MLNHNYNLTQPLPGWVRFHNTETGQNIDINPADSAHRVLLERYSQNPKWQIISQPTAR